jgi:hypothetical protein
MDPIMELTVLTGDIVRRHRRAYGLRIDASESRYKGNKQTMVYETDGVLYDIARAKTRYSRGFYSIPKSAVDISNNM